MTRQRQADLLLVLTTLIAACGWIFSREAISGMPVFAFLGLRFLAQRWYCCLSASDNAFRWRNCAGADQRFLDGA